MHAAVAPGPVSTPSTWRTAEKAWRRDLPADVHFPKRPATSSARYAAPGGNLAAAKALCDVPMCFGSVSLAYPPRMLSACRAMDCSRRAASPHLGRRGRLEQRLHAGLDPHLLQEG